MINNIINKIKNKTLTHYEFNIVMNDILSGKISDKKIADILYYLAKKRETNEELLSTLKKLIKFSVHVPLKNKNAIDICGTGGDKKNTFNISTAASFVVASLNVMVAKHGNRSSSSLVGSADIFEYFGYDVRKSPNQIIQMLNKYNICFMFAQIFHPELKNVHNTRKSITIPTIFNIVGPISNPANVKNQLIGVYDDDLIQRLPKILHENGSKNIMTVRSIDGLDEISTTAKNHICILKNKKINEYFLDTQELGLNKIKLSDIQISNKLNALTSFISVLNNSANKPLIEITAVNAAAGLIIANVVDNFQDALNISLNAIYDKKPYKLFKKFIAEYGDIKKLEKIECEI